MKLVSWNVNGLRALFKQGYWQWFEDEQPDVFCLQEIKAEELQLPPEVANPSGYFASFNSSDERKGYSGVATYSKEKPIEVLYDILPEGLNNEGRLIQSRFKDFVLLNGYFPNGGKSEEHFKYKLRFYDAFLEHVENLRKNGDKVIFCGDLNVAHEEIDIARPKENENNTGFLPEEREWFDQIIALGYIDTLRHLYPDKTSLYSWWDVKSRARDRNIGWRIDYFVISPDLLPKLKGAEIMTDVYGSDHAPVAIDIDL